MKTIAALTLTLATATASLGESNQNAINDQLNAHLKKNPSVKWQVEDTWLNKFADYKLRDVQALMGTKIAPPSGKRIPNNWETSDAAALPKSFDSRTAFGTCEQSIRDQMHCGSCWAFGAAETLSENLCISGVLPPDAMISLSPQDMVSCDNTDYGCKGGELSNAWNYLTNTGIVTDDCLPYTAGIGQVDQCPANDKCSEDSMGEKWKKYKCETTVNQLQDENDIKNGVMQYGTAETAFTVYEDFIHYKGGVYKHDATSSSKVLGGHAVRIMGWGNDEQAGEYWIVANSWGSGWGENGYFKIALDDTASGFADGGAYNCGDLQKGYTVVKSPADM